MTVKTETLDARAINLDEARTLVLRRLERLKPGQALDILTANEPAPILRAALAEFPLAFDFSPLRASPGQWRYHIFRRDTRPQRTVTDYLAWDHDRLDALLESSLDHARRQDWAGAQALAEDFEHGLNRHIEIEEGILFPAFERATGLFADGPTQVMRHEHVDIRQFVTGLVDAARRRDYDGMERHRADLLGVLVPHNMKEESVLYPTTDRFHHEAELESLVLRLMLG
ncbi:MAG: hemerythrin domain-containing protein [Planctomycetes bacterium]|nr:hemerythrin domain-containing protein [Planctomycetota bacterium]MCL4731610.1 hemerythrin domain-containing protein [Planctomycetota bacterium]